jgi:hypothetical protein
MGKKNYNFKRRSKKGKKLLFRDIRAYYHDDGNSQSRVSVRAEKKCLTQ